MDKQVKSNQVRTTEIKQPSVTTQISEKDKTKKKSIPDYILKILSDSHWSRSSATESTPPQEYIVKKPTKDLLALQDYILENGYKGHYFMEPCSYLNIGEYKYRIELTQHDQLFIFRTKI